MNPTTFAMKHPITTLTLVVAMVAAGLGSLARMQIEIFPSLHEPRIYVFLQYGGMSPAQMEGLVVNQFELMFQYVDGISEIKSRNIQQVSLVELSFFPDTDMGVAEAAVVAMANRAMSRMPPGTLPPMVMRLDEGSVPVGYLVLESDKIPLGLVADYAQNIIRPQIQANVPGTLAVSPFGPNIRTILVEVDPQKLQAYNVTPQHVVDALMTGNVIIPAGNVYIRDQMPMVPNNALVVDIQDIGKIPLRMGRNVYIHDVAKIVDGTDIDYGCALVNGKRAVWLPIIKKASASTLTVVDDIYKSLDIFRDAVPEAITINFEFDESATVTDAIQSVASESFIGAVLTGFAIIIFLRDLRSVLIVVLTIPLSLCFAVVGLYATGNTINIMSLGGLALAIGMLVDTAIVCIENIHVQMGQTKSLARAVARGTAETAVPRFLAMLCILSVFIPAFIMKNPMRGLFTPLALAVGFAMIASYVLSSTFVPIIGVWILKRKGEEKEGFFARFQKRFEGWVTFATRHKRIVTLLYVIFCGVILWQVGERTGTELFPRINAREFVLRYRPPRGSNWELTREMGVRILKLIEKDVGPDNVEVTIGYAGQIAPNFGMNNIVLFMRGPDDGWLRVRFRDGAGIDLVAFQERMRKLLPEKINPWLAGALEKHGVMPDVARQRASSAMYGFEPGNIITQVMSFGSPTPIEIAVSSPDLAQARAHALRIREHLLEIPFLRDIEFQQTLEYPTVQIDIDRQKAGLSGVTMEQAGSSAIMATSSSRFIALNYWMNPATGFDYQVEVLVPTNRMTSAEQVARLPIGQVNDVVNLMIRDVATIKESQMMGEYDRVSSQRFLSLTANVVGESMAGASRQIKRAIAAAGKPPRGVQVFVRGQIPPMDNMFFALGVGLSIAVVVILLLLTAYFESPRLAITSISAVPCVLAGVVVILLLTGSTINLESFMGTIMCIGVSVSNSVMLVSVANDHWRAGMAPKDAAIQAATQRLRPILMTASAMIVGMVPMSMALEAGSQMQAPLGRAVIGGLTMSTVGTLIVVPAIFALVLGESRRKPMSVNPDDPESRHFEAQDEDSPESETRENP